MQVNISDYAGGVSGGDWSPALLAAYNDIQATGGKIVFDEQNTWLKTQVSLTPDVGSQVPLILEGDGSNEIKVTNSGVIHRIVAGSTSRVTVRDLMFVGDGGASTVVDGGAVLDFNQCLQALVDGCVFAGIRSSTVIIDIGTDTTFKMRDSQLGGCAGTVVRGSGPRFVELDNCEFLDYFVNKFTYHSKTPAGAAWVVFDTPPTGNGANAPTIKIKKCRFDEGSGNGIFITGYPKVDIEQCSFNAANFDGGSGIKLVNVKHAIIKQCHVGYNAADAAIVRLTNCENVVIVGQGRDNGPMKIIKDGASTVKLLQSPSVTIETV